MYTFIFYFFTSDRNYVLTDRSVNKVEFFFMLFEATIWNVFKDTKFFYSIIDFDDIESKL